MIKKFFSLIGYALITFLMLFTSCGKSHEYVDLGLPSGTLWATCNVGATKPEEYGDYFAWGETETKTTYSEDNCKWDEVQYSVLEEQGVVDGSGNLTAKYDAATVNWGDDWRMPTKDEIKELLTLENQETTINGVNGMKFIGKNGNTLFLPFADTRYDDRLPVVGEEGNYWSATVWEKNDRWITWSGAYYLFLFPKEETCTDGDREHGRSVRPVLRTK